ncbi:MAG: 2,3-bisphosphoglycerate-independent phosphoglycerate mutase [Actinomycetota bacterium]
MDEFISSLARPAHTKMVMLVIDGLGGAPSNGRPSEITAANTPNLDALAASGCSGVHTVVAPGVTPGSGAGHLALFGYNPIEYQLGRGAICAAGIGFDMGPLDIAARVNFCTIDSEGSVLDRRAGRIPSETNQRLCKLIMDNVQLGPDIQVIMQTERDHRALLVLRADGLSPMITDTDPQKVGLVSGRPLPRSPEAQMTAGILEDLLGQIRDILAGETANYILLRGFDTLRNLPRFPTIYRLRATGIAAYPMYVGIARILGMNAGPALDGWDRELEELKSAWDPFDFFFIHYKPADAAGEDGDFDRKCAAIEEVDRSLPSIMDLNPDVICVTGDHATPAYLKGHSWHPVPFVIAGSAVGNDEVAKFDERWGRQGGYGHVRATDIMPLILAAGGRLAKFGA